MARCTVWIVACSLTVLATLGAFMVNRRALHPELQRRRPIIPDSAIREFPLRISPSGMEVDSRVGVLDSVIYQSLPSIRETFPPVHELTHALRLVGASFEHPHSFSSQQILQVLFDSKYHAEHYAGRPLLYRSTVGFGVRLSSGRGDPGGASHYDKLLQVAGEIGLPSGHEVTVDGERLLLRDGIRDMLYRFNLDQELEFSAVAIALYLPPTNSWVIQHGIAISIDQVAEALIARNLGACHNLHRLYALAVLLRADDVSRVLSVEVRAHVEDYLQSIASLLSRRQDIDGQWDPSLLDPDRVIQQSEFGKIVATGHHLEWIAIVPRDLRPPPAIVDRAIRGVIVAISRCPRDLIRSHYGPISHVARAICLLQNRSFDALLREAVRRREQNALGLQAPAPER